VLTKGRYVATADVSFPASMLASSDLIRSKLIEKGFTNVQVSDQKPAGFPLPGSGDYYVSVDWPSAPKVFDVPGAVTAHRKIA
jgi:hypothetical protein